MNIPSNFLLSRLILHYGLFAVIAHSLFILLYARLASPLTPLYAFSTLFPMIEHSIVSFICVLLGSLLFFYIAKKEATSK